MIKMSYKCWSSSRAQLLKDWLWRPIHKKDVMLRWRQLFCCLESVGGYGPWIISVYNSLCNNTCELPYYMGDLDKNRNSTKYYGGIIYRSFAIYQVCLNFHQSYEGNFSYLSYKRTHRRCCAVFSKMQPQLRKMIKGRPQLRLLQKCNLVRSTPWPSIINSGFSLQMVIKRSKILTPRNRSWIYLLTW